MNSAVFVGVRLTTRLACTTHGSSRILPPALAYPPLLLPCLQDGNTALHLLVHRATESIAPASLGGAGSVSLGGAAGRAGAAPSASSAGSLAAMSVGSMSVGLPAMAANGGSSAEMDAVLRCQHAILKFLGPGNMREVRRGGSV
jgi:hypothetical protein